VDDDMMMIYEVKLVEELDILAGTRRYHTRGDIIY